MTRPSRRTLLSSTAGLLALSAGCIADGTGDSPDDGTDADDEDPGSTGEETDDLPGELVDYETQGYQYPAGESTSVVDVVRDADDATEWLEARSLSDAEPLTELVDDTNFETSLLISLESEAPSSCYELLLESIDVRPIEDDGRSGEESVDSGGESDGSSDESGENGDETDETELVLEAEVRDTTDENEMCTQPITTVGRLVRATFESEPPTALSATIVDHEGNTSGGSMRSDSASASESASTGSGSESDDGS